MRFGCSPNCRWRLRQLRFFWQILLEEFQIEPLLPLSLHFSIGELVGTAHSVDNGMCTQTIVPEVSYAQAYYMPFCPFAPVR